MPILPLRRHEDAIKFPPQIKDRWHYPVSSLVCSTIDVKQSASGRYSGYFADTQLHHSFSLFEFASVHPITTMSGNDRHVYGRWIAGMLSSQAADVGFGGAVASATAQGSGKIETNKFRASVRGIDEPEWSKLRAITSLDADGMLNLGAALSQPVAWSIANAGKLGGKAVSPGAVYLVEETKHDPKASFVFALNQIWKGSTLPEAKQALDGGLCRHRTRARHVKIDPLAVAAMYHRLRIGDEERPSRDQSKQARRILKGDEELPSANGETQKYRFQVPPFLTEDYAVPSLLYLAPDNHSRVQVHPWPPNKDDLPPAPLGSTEARSVDVETALRVNVASMLNVEAESDINTMGYGFTADYTRAGKVGSLIHQEIYSVGVDVYVMYSGTDVSLDVAAVAAKATTGLLNVNYTISVLGIDLSALTKLGPFVASSIGKFDVTTLNGIGVIHEEASQVLSDTGPSWTPVLSAVDVNLGEPEVQALCDEGLRKFTARRDSQKSRDSGELESEEERELLELGQ